MSTSPRRRRRVRAAQQGASRRLLRTVLVAAGLFAVLSTTPALSDLPSVAPVEVDRPALAIPAATPPTQAGSASDNECSRFLADFCEEVPQPRNRPNRTPVAQVITEEVPSCLLSTSHDPQTTTTTIATSGAGLGDVATIRYRVEIEDGLVVDGECFAAAVAGVLNDPRGWTADGGFKFMQVGGEDDYDFRLILASPTTTNQLCWPAATGGKYSCRNREKVVLNLTRWSTGTEEFLGEITTYRQYLINHEVGHFLGHSHRTCPEAGALAPVMMQQTKGVGDCLLNGWPTDDERK